MVEEEKVNRLLKEFGEKVVAQLKNDIKNKPIPRGNGKSYVVDASGKLAESVMYEVENGVLRVYAAEYIGAVIFGRGPTKNDGTPGGLRKKIRQWIDDKPVVPPPGMTKDSLAFLITRRIHKEGTLLYPDGSTLLSDIVNQRVIDELKSDLFGEIIDGALETFRTLKQAA